MRAQVNQQKRRADQREARPDYGGFQACIYPAANANLNLRPPWSELRYLDLVTRVVKVVCFIASDTGFTGQPQVANGASDLLGQAFGDAGVHARSAVGVPVLPLDAPVEVEIVVEV